MTIFYTLGAASICLALLSGFFNLKDKPYIRLLCKLVASLLFVAIGLSALYEAHTITTYGIMVMSGLTLGLIGDILLSMQGLATPSANKFFYALGIACFAIGHIIFAATFLVIVEFNALCLLFIPIIPITLTILVVTKFIKAKKLTPVFIVYSFILGLMMAASINFYWHNNNTSGILVLVAGILFSASDCILVVRDFSVIKARTLFIYFILLTYYIAQIFFATTIYLTVM